MIVADGLLAGRLGVNVVQRQRDFDELLAVGQASSVVSESSGGQPCDFRSVTVVSKISLA